MDKKTISETFKYRNGQLYWRAQKTRAAKGQRAGNLDKRGYTKITCNGRRYYAHRLIFALHHGACPRYVDHVNGQPDDNRIKNLRGATHKQNIYNQKKRADNKSGFKGVCYRPERGVWRAYITANRRQKFLGNFKTAKAAALAYDAAAAVLHGSFAHLNFK